MAADEIDSWRHELFKFTNEPTFDAPHISYDRPLFERRAGLFYQFNKGTCRCSKEDKVSIAAR